MYLSSSKFRWGLAVEPDPKQPIGSLGNVPIMLPHNAVPCHVRVEHDGNGEDKHDGKKLLERLWRDGDLVVTDNPRKCGDFCHRRKRRGRDVARPRTGGACASGRPRSLDARETCHFQWLPTPRRRCSGRNATPPLHRDAPLRNSVRDHQDGAALPLLRPQISTKHATKFMTQ
jgi:hypothetical protein